MKKVQGAPEPIQTELSRDLGLTTVLSIGIGTMIAAGIFTLSGLAVRNVGSSAVISFLLAALVASFTALTYCEFTSIYPESGEGYLYARRTFTPPLAYLVGWTLLLGYISSCAFYISSLSSYFDEFIWQSPFEQLAGMVALAALVLLNIKGTKETARFQVIVTAGKVLLLIWFVFGGMFEIDASALAKRMSKDFVAIGATAGLVFITFFGFSAIAASAGEVRNPTRTIPMAIFISMGAVTVLYTLVVFVMVAADLSEYTESAMGNAARMFLGPVGGMVIVAGALFSMISASNATIMAGSRVALSMSQLHHLPQGIGAINPRTRTPVISLILVGGGILLFARSFELEDLAHFADTILLLALILVNVALIYHRRKFPDIERPFRVPLVPLLPGLGIVFNLYLLVQILDHIEPVVMAVGWLAMGMLGFLAWKGFQVEEESLPGLPSRVAQVSPAGGESRFRILVPIANPDNVIPLVDLAAAVAGDRSGEIVGLRVVQLPEQLPLNREASYVERERRILEQAHARAREHNVPMTSLIRIGYNTARAILETSRERHCNLILLGWKGYTSTAKRILGEVVDEVVAHARTDIMLVKLVGEIRLKNILLPTAGGAHSRLAEQFGVSLARSQGGELVVFGVVPPEVSEEREREVREHLAQALERVSELDGDRVQSKVVRHKSVSVGIIQEAKNHDAVIVGASREGFFQHILFGSIPESVAKHTGKPVIVVKHYSPVKALVERVMED